MIINLDAMAEGLEQIVNNLPKGHTGVTGPYTPSDSLCLGCLRADVLGYVGLLRAEAHQISHGFKKER